MKKFIGLFLICFLFSFSKAHAWGRLGYGANIVTINSGDTLVPFSVSVGTTTPVKLFTSATKYREITVENPSASYLLYVSTFSTFTSASGQTRLFVPKQGFLKFRSTENLWGLYESGAGSGTLEVLGGYEYDSKD